MEMSGHLGPLIGRCAHRCRSYMDQTLQEYGITQAQTHVMLYLLKMHGRGEVTQKDMERSFHIKAPTVNGIVDRLEEKGFVERQTSAVDARRRCVCITDKGMEMEQVFHAGMKATERRIARGMTKEEIAQFRELLERAAANLEGGK